MPTLTQIPEDRRSVKLEVAPTKPKAAAEPARMPTPRQHRPSLSVLLHLFPGLVLAAFVATAAPLVESWSLDPLFTFLFGIALVIAPLELGYLAIQAKKATGSWSPLRAVYYRERLAFRRVFALAAIPSVFMVVLVALSMAFVDERLAASLFGWLPNAITEMATVTDSGDPLSGAAFAVLLIAFVLLNGFLGPVAEELYFRGHLLPRIDRFGWKAPMLGAVLFALYHFHTPWRYPAIVMGFLPITWLAWRKRSYRVSLAAHLLINNIFILMMLAAFLDSA